MLSKIQFSPDNQYKLIVSKFMYGNGNYYTPSRVRRVGQAMKSGVKGRFGNRPMAIMSFGSGNDDFRHNLGARVVDEAKRDE